MADHKELIKALRLCRTYENRCNECPYFGGNPDEDGCFDLLHEEAAKAVFRYDNPPVELGTTVFAFFKPEYSNRLSSMPMEVVEIAYRKRTAEKISEILVLENIHGEKREYLFSDLGKSVFYRWIESREALKRYYGGT